jgi:uncharacterized membrane protein (UPF0127 family)
MPRGMACITCEVASTPSAHKHGLMFRDHLDDDYGMLFDFKKDQPLSFWGMNTHIPLDIAFIDKSGNIVNTGLIKPNCLDSVRSASPCMYALEVPQGTFKKHSIGEGDYAEILRKELMAKVFLLKKISKDYIKVAFADVDSGGKLEADADAGSAKDSLILNKSDKKSPKFSSIFQALDWCISNNEVCRITYRTSSGNTITRDVEPHDIFYGRKKHNQILLTWDENVVGPRSYVIMRIISYSIPGRKFTKKVQLY